MARVLFNTPMRPAMPEARLQPELEINLAQRSVSGFLKLGDSSGMWRASISFDFAFSDLDLSGTGGPIARLTRGILLRAIATGLIPQGEIEAGD